jgi:hypothetical protein
MAGYSVDVYRVTRLCGGCGREIRLRWMVTPECDLDFPVHHERSVWKVESDERFGVCVGCLMRAVSGRRGLARALLDISECRGLVRPTLAADILLFTSYRYVIVQGLLTDELDAQLRRAVADILGGTFVPDAGVDCRTEILAIVGVYGYRAGYFVDGLRAPSQVGADAEVAALEGGATAGDAKTAARKAMRLARNTLRTTWPAMLDEFNARGG